MISFTKGKLKFVQVPYNARIVCNVYLPTEIYIQQQWFLSNATMNDFWAKLLRRDLRSQFSGGNFSEYRFQYDEILAADRFNRVVTLQNKITGNPCN